MGVAVGNCSMEEKQVFQNVQMSVNFLVSLLKKNWQNVRSFCVVKIKVSCSFCVVVLHRKVTQNYLCTAGPMLVPEEYHGQAIPHFLSVVTILLAF